MKRLPWAIAIGCGPAGCGVACGMAYVLRGKNTSDVGVPMYSNGPTAILVGLGLLLVGHVLAGLYLKDQERPVRLTGLISLMIFGIAGVFMVGFAASF